MNTNKFITGGIVGGIVYFLLGYLFYGTLFKSFFDQNGMAVNTATIIWWALIIANLVLGFLLSYIIGKAAVSSIGRGAGIGFVVGLLIELSGDLAQYATASMHLSKRGIGVDTIISAIISLIAGGFIGWIYGMSKKEKAATS